MVADHQSGRYQRRVNEPKTRDISAKAKRHEPNTGSLKQITAPVPDRSGEEKHGVNVEPVISTGKKAAQYGECVAVLEFT